MKLENVKVVEVFAGTYLPFEEEGIFALLHFALGYANVDFVESDKEKATRVTINRELTDEEKLHLAAEAINLAIKFDRDSKEILKLLYG